MSEKNCILIVDDDEGVRKSLTLILKKKGYLVESAATGKEALAIAQGMPVSLTLLDVKLPDIMGTQLLAPLKQTNPDMSIIMITGFASVKNAVQSLTAGASGYITKPIDLDNLLARIKTTLDQQHLVTEVRRAEAALRESEEKFRGIFDTINDGIHIYEIEQDGKPGKFIEVNEVACRMLQYTREELLEHGPLDIVSGYHSWPLAEITGELSSTGHAIFETGHCRKDGTIVPVEINTHVVNLQGKRMTVSAIRDITERKLVEDALTLANIKLNLLSSITQHDINNQLTALNTYISLSEDAIDNPVELKKFLDTVQKIADSIAHQIGFTKDYEDLGVKALAWQNVNQIIKKVITQLPMRNVHVDDAVDPDLEIFADPLLEKVFYNLTDNALRYGGELMTAIRVTNHEDNGMLVIVMEDNGIGVSTDDKKKLFTKGFGKHTGFGLYLSCEILSITNLSITETSIFGQGARFEITVPKGKWRIIGKDRMGD